MPDLPAIFLRFRRWRIALSADVTKAFLQIRISRQDRDVHRFLWDEHGVVRRMRCVRLPFGNKSSPFLLNATIKHHLSQFPHSRVIEELSENMYVDDWLSWCDDDADGCAMLREADEVMGQAGMSLAKWGSNSEQVLLCREFQDFVGQSSKVLGIPWLANQDCFSFDGVTMPRDRSMRNETLGTESHFVSIWPPGIYFALHHGSQMLVPGTMEARRSLGWSCTRAYTREIHTVDQGYGASKDMDDSSELHRAPWRDIAVFQLCVQAFGDASQSAYGTCVYLLVQPQDGTWKSSLVMARAKVAPLKRLSLPRLELLSALLYARLVVYVRQAMKLPEDVVCHCWTDSTVALAWIQSDPHKWKPFVSNRVTEIQTRVSPSQWYHCPGKENPAELVTRVIMADELLKSQLWLQGPNFLTESDTPGYGSRVIDGNLMRIDRVLATWLALNNFGNPIFQITCWSVWPSRKGTQPFMFILVLPLIRMRYWTLHAGVVLLELCV